MLFISYDENFGLFIIQRKQIMKSNFFNCDLDVTTYEFFNFIRNLNYVINILHILISRYFKI